MSVRVTRAPTTTLPDGSETVPRITPVVAWACAAREVGQHASTSAAPTRRLERRARRSEEHTFELQSRQYLVCRLLLEKKKKKKKTNTNKSKNKRNKRRQYSN